MERLTIKRPDGRWAIANNDGANPTEQMLKIPKVINRLGDIEEILGDEYDLDHLRELVQADASRRRGRYDHMALAARHIKQAKEGKYYQCENCDFWSEGDPRCMCEDSQWAGCTVKKDNYCGHFQPQVEHIQTET